LPKKKAFPYLNWTLLKAPARMAAYQSRYPGLSAKRNKQAASVTPATEKPAQKTESNLLQPVLPAKIQ